MDWFDWVNDLLDFLVKHWGVVWRVAVVVLGLAVCGGAVYLVGGALHLF